MLNLFFPKLCNGCLSKLSGSEKTLCTACRHQLPLACHHRSGDPAMKQIFYGRIPVEAATALLYFTKKGVVQQLLHQLKYRGQAEISTFLGKWLGAELAESGYFKTIDLVMPVPLHPSRQRKRGYNQVSGFGKEISICLDVPYREDILLRTRKGSSQTLFKRQGRFRQQQFYELAKAEAVCGKHVLLVDDIVTTGATIEQCAGLLLKEEGVSLSVATMAVAS